MARRVAHRGGARRAAAVATGVLAVLAWQPVEARSSTGALRQYTFDSQRLSDRIAVSVNVGNGNLMTQERDLVASGALGPALALVRVSNSSTNVARAFGWDMSMDSGADVSLAVQVNGDVDFTGPSAYTLRFVRRADGTFVVPSGLDATLVKRADGTYAITEHQSQTTWSFTTAGRLTQLEDRNGRKLTYQYNADGTLATVTDVPEQSGDLTRQLTFAYDASKRVNRVTDAAGRAYTYTYDAAGYLATYTDPAAKVTRYRNESGRLTVITTPAGRVTKIGYHPTGDPNAGRVKSVMRVTNPTALESSWSGPTSQYAYSLAADRSGTVSVTDPRGGVWTYTIDTNSRVTKTQAPTSDGQRLTSSQTWTPSSKVNQFTAPGTAANPSATTNLTFDANDNVSGSTTPAGAGTLYTGAKYGQSPGASGPGAQYLPTTVYNENDYAGTAGSSVGGSDPTTSYGIEYNGLGNLRLAKRNSTIAASVAIAYVSEIKGDPGAGRIASSTDPRGAVTRYAHDSAGNMIRSIPPTVSSGTQMGDTTFDYSATTVDRALNRMSSRTDGKLQKQTHTYDALDRITQVRFTNSAGTIVEDVFFVYDADGNLIERRDGTGTTIYQYDALGRVDHQDAPGPGFVDPGYDAASNLTSLTDESGTVTYGYKPNNRLASMSEPGGSCSTSPTSLCTTYSYDDSGAGSTTLPAGIARSVTQRLPNGIITVEQMDAAGRLIKTESMLNGTSPVQGFTYQYQHSNGRETALRSSETERGGAKQVYAYDALERLRRVDVYNSSGTLVDWQAFGWDAASNRTSVDRKPTCGKWAHKVSYSYNNYNQLISMGDGGLNGSENCAYGTNATWTYDANGNLLQECSNGGTTATRTTSRSTSTVECGGAFTYNIKNQLTSGSRVYAGVGQSEIVSEWGASFTNSFLGILSQGGTTYFTRTDEGRLVSQRRPAATAPNRRQYYLLDSLGSVRTLTDETGGVVSRATYGPFGDGGAGGTFSFASGRNTGGGTLHFGERYYEARNARWTQPDPLNQYEDIRQANRYAYVGGDPVNLLDPTGQGIWDTVQCIGAVGTFIAGNLFLIAKVRKAGGVVRVAKRLAAAENWADRYKAAMAFFGDITGLGAVVKTCG